MATKAQRIQSKINEGRTHIEAEIEVAEEDMAAKLAALKARQAKEEAKVRELIMDYLETEHSELYITLRDAARRQLRSESASRRQRAQASARTEEPQD